MFSLGREQTVQIPGGKSVTLGKLTVRVIRAYGEYVRERVGDPFERVERFLGRAPDAEVARMLKEAESVAEQLRFFSPGCPLAVQAMGSPEGAAKLVHLLMLEKDGKAAEADAELVAMHLAERQLLGRTIGDAQGSREGAAEPAAEGAEGNAPGPA